MPWRLQLWLNTVFSLAERVTTLSASTLSAKRRTLERQLANILAAASSCDLTRALQAKIGRAREQLLTFLDHPGLVEATNNACERALRPAGIQRKVTNGYRAMWAAQGEAAVRKWLPRHVGRSRRGRSAHRGRHRTSETRRHRLRHHSRHHQCLKTTSLEAWVITLYPPKCASR